MCRPGFFSWGAGGGREPLGPAPAAPAFPSWPRPCGGGGDPALQTKVNCFRCSRAWPPAPAPCAQVLRGLCSRGRAPEQHRPGYGWKGAGEREQEHNGRQPWGRVAGMWTLQGSFGFWLRPTGCQDFLFSTCIHFSFPLSLCLPLEGWLWSVLFARTVCIHSAKDLGLSLLRECLGRLDGRWWN